MRVAVVIPVHDEQDLIRDCLECLSRQTVLPDRVIIVDNNTSDASIAIARRYDFVRVVREDVPGICASTKRGLDIAADDADVLLRCDADSRPHVDWVERILRDMSGNTVAAVTGPGEFYDLRGLKKWLATTFYMQLYFMSVRLALRQKPLFGSNFAIKAEVWRAISNHTHLWRQDIHDDMDISFHVVTKGEILFDKHLSMPISPRPFDSFGAVLKRVPMGMRSILIHWPDRAPWRIGSKTD